MVEATIISGYANNPMTAKQALNLAKAFKARGLRVPPKIAKKASGRSSYASNKRRGRPRGGRKGSKWMTLVKKYGIKGAAVRYKKNVGATANPRRGRRRAYASNFGTRAGGLKAARKLSKAHYRRIGKKGARARWGKAYASNPRRRRYRRNPALPVKGIFGQFKATVVTFPKLADYKSKPLHGVGFGILGLIDSAIYGAIVDLVTKPKGKEVKAAVSPGRDIARILTKFLGGTLTSMGVAHLTKDKKNGTFHQLGVTVCTILDLVGTGIKHATRAQAGLLTKGFNGQIELTPTVRNVAIELLGFGQIDRAWAERNIIVALKKGIPISVWKAPAGYGYIKNDKTGKILITGSLSGIQDLAGRLSGVNPKQFGANVPAIGEDITVEGNDKE